MGRSVRRRSAQARFEVCVLVPDEVHEDLDEPDPALDQPASHQTTAAVGCGHLVVQAIRLAGGR